MQRQVIDKEKPQFHFKVGWKRKHPKAPWQNVDYIAESLKQLLDLLDRAENVSPGNVECMYVHQIMENGTVVEVYKHEAASNVTVFDFTTKRPISRERKEYSEQNRVLKEVDRIIQETRSAEDKLPVLISKPRIRLKTNGRKFIDGGFFYRAYEATHTR